VCVSSISTVYPPPHIILELLATYSGINVLFKKHSNKRYLYNSVRLIVVLNEKPIAKQYNNHNTLADLKCLEWKIPFRKILFYAYMFFPTSPPDIYAVFFSSLFQNSNLILSGDIF
ncbi:hypothetical protein H312_02794, partial [Anncaliia algerae PRA339]